MSAAGGPPRIGRYVLLGELGAGAGGVVMSAFDERLDRRVAIKLMREHADDHSVLHEAQALARLSHPNVVHVYEVGEHRGGVYLAMEFIKGVDLRRWVERDSPSVGAIVEAYRQAGAGLAAAHRAGLVHRDVKPSNLMLGVDGRVRVVDFGLSGDARRRETVAVVDTGEDALDETTRSGGGGGTPSYMSPEQVTGLDVDERSDQFGFCVALYEAVAGVLPFAGSDAAARLDAIRRGVLAPPRLGKTMPAWLRRALARGLAVDPAARWPDLPALLAEIAPRRSRGRAAAAASVVVGATALAVAFGPRNEAAASPCSGGEAALADVLDEPRIAGVHAAIAGVALPIADDIGARVEARLLDHRANWLAVHRDRCEATAVRHEQSPATLDRQMSCLSRLRAELDAVLRTLETPSTALVLEAQSAIDRVASATGCAELGVDASTGSRPAADEEAIAAGFAEIAALELRSDAGEKAARDEIDQWVRRAETDGPEPLLARALYARGAQASSELRTTEAAADLARAHELAVAHGEDELAMRSASYLGTVVGAELGRHADGLAWADVADAWWRRADRSSEGHVRLVVNRNKTLGAAGELAEVARLGALAIAELEAAGAEGGLVEAALRSGLSVAALRGDAFTEAVRHGERAVECLEATYGDGHPSVANGLANLSHAYLRAGRIDDADARARRALAIVEAAWPQGDVRVARALSDVGELARVRGDHAQALELQRRATAMLEQALEPGHARLGLAYYNLANAALAAGRASEGLTAIARSLEIRERALGPKNRSVAATLGLRAELRLAAGETEGAVADASRATAITMEVLGPTAIDTAVAQTQLAHALASAGRREDALQRLAPALVLFDRVDPRRATEAWIDAAAIHRAAGDEAMAREALQRAEAAARRGLPADHPRQAWLRDALGERR